MGYGKTAIAQSICRALDNSSSKRLRASFFISAAYAPSRDPFAVVRTIAYQLALRLPRMRTHICASLRAQPHTAIGTLEDHIDRFISSPLREELPTSTPLIIVLDGLNACRRVHGEDGRSLFHQLSRAIVHKQLPIKLIASGFSRLPTLIDGCRGSTLASVLPRIVREDMEVYLRARFETIRYSREGLPHDWPKPSDISLLAERSEFLFLFASTVLRFVASLHHDPLKRLQEIIDDIAPITSFEVMDKLYLRILHAIIEEVLDGDRDHVCENFRRIIGSVVLVQQPLTLSTLSLLTGYTPLEIRGTLTSIDSLVSVPQTETDSLPIRPYHPSFGTFVTHPRRCTSVEFCVNPNEGHAFLAERCFLLMEKRLRKNMGGIKDGSRANDDIPDLAHTVTKHLSSALQYACMYWSAHAIASEDSGVVEQFIRRLSLNGGELLSHWIEACSLLREMLHAQAVLEKLYKWCQVRALQQ
jgi:hypothetical protein